MTMLRLFKSPLSRKKSTAPPLPLVASVQVPAYGITDIAWPSDLPGADVPVIPFQGSVEIDLSAGSGPVRITKVTVCFQAFARLEREGQKQRVIYEVEERVLASERVIHGFER